MDVDRRDDRAEWLRREGGIEGRRGEVNKKNDRAGGGQIISEGRRQERGIMREERSGKQSDLVRKEKMRLEVACV